LISSDLAELFSILGDPTRLRILSMIREGETSVQILSENLGISHSAVSHQLRLLRAHRLVQNRRDGRNVLYTLDDQCIWDILHAGESHLEHRHNGETNKV
jgi:ArsR family transcriptional regulator, lead/cadmium/zinc/bismuth-responsive transcriptional repressor